MSNARKLADNLPSVGQLGNRNLIINGGMQVAQRATSKTGAQVTGYHTLDRWQTYSAATDQLAVTMSQDTSVPSGQGFSNSMKFLTATAETAIASDEEFRFWQKIEAQNLKVLDWGTSDAKQITFSFWVKSSLTGNYALSLYTGDSARQTSKTYTISSADTWEKKIVTFVGDTGSTINLDNGIGMLVNFFLMAGSDTTSSDPAGAWASHAAARHAFGHTASWGTNTSHNFYITGIQLEVGSQASPFEHNSYQKELEASRRYYQRKYLGNIGIGWAEKANDWNYNSISLSPIMRATPTTSYQGGVSGGTWHSTAATNGKGFGANSGEVSTIYHKANGASNDIYLGGNDFYVIADAEL